MSAELDVDAHVLEVDLLAWASWNRPAASTVTRDAVVNYVVRELKARNVWCGDRPEAGLKALLGGLSGLPWVEREFGATVAYLAQSGMANVDQAVADNRAALDGLVRLIVRWAHPLLVLNARARLDAQSRAQKMIHGWPREERPSGFWANYLHDNVRGSGFAQSNVTKALLASCGTSEEAAALLAAADLEAPARVALAHRLEFLRRKAVPLALEDSGGGAILALVRELAQILGDTADVVTTPPEEAVDPAPVDATWTGPIGEEYLLLARQGRAVLRRAGVDEVAADIILDQALDEMATAAVDGRALRGTWLRLVDNKRREYFKRSVRARAEPGLDESEPADDPSPSEIDQSANRAARSERLTERLHDEVRARADSTPEWLLVKKLLGEPELLQRFLGKADEIPSTGDDREGRRQTQLRRELRLWIGHEVPPGTDADLRTKQVVGLLNDLYTWVREP